MTKIDTRPVCALCGYLATKFVVFQVPMTTRTMSKVVCVECVDELISRRRQQQEAG